MKLTIFDLKKHETAIRRLEARKAPSYVIEAYNEGFTKQINDYYKVKLKKRLNKTIIKESNINKSLLNKASKSEYNFIKEAAKKRDEDFLKQFFTMTNLDIVTGRKLPPNAGNLVKQGIVKDISLKDLFKKLR